MIYTLGVLLAFSRLITPSAFPMSHGSVVSLKWYDQIVACMRDLFFLNDNVPLPTSHKGNIVVPLQRYNATHSASEIAGTAITSVFLFCKYIMGTFSDLGLLILIFTLWSPASDFENLLELQVSMSMSMSSALNDEKSEIEDGKRKEVPCINTDFIISFYEHLRELAKMINTGFGQLLLSSIAEAVFTYAINFNYIIFFMGSLPEGFVICSFYVLFLSILFVSGSICQKVLERQQQFKIINFLNNKLIQLTVAI